MNLRIVLVFVLSSALSAWMHRDILDSDIRGLHDWRQSMTMWNIRNFVHYDNDIKSPRLSSFNKTNNNVLRLEYPIMQWGIAQVIRITGVTNEVRLTRISMYVIGLAGLVAFFLLLCAMAFPPWVALAGTVLLQFNPLLYFYTVNVLPDLFALSVSLWYIYFSFLYFRDRRWWQLLAAALALGVATLAKLPFAMLGIVGGVYIFTHLIRNRRIDWSVVLFAAVHLLCAVPAYRWYSWVMAYWHNSPIQYGIFGPNTSGESYQTIVDYFLNQYLPFDLNSPAVWGFFVLGIFLPARRNAPVPYARYVWGMAVVTLLWATLQANTIELIHDYYLLPLLPWMYIVVTAGVGRVWAWATGRTDWVRTVSIGAIAAGLLAAPVAASYLATPKWDLVIGSYYGDLKDVHRYRKDLRAVTDDDDLVIVLNDPTMQVFTWLIRKRGYAFANNHVQPHWIDDMRRHGATHLYSNSRRIDQDSAFQTRFDSLILERGDIKVYRLK